MLNEPLYSIQSNYFSRIKKTTNKLYKKLLKIKNENLQRFLHLIYQKQVFEIQKELAEILKEKDPKALIDFLAACFTLIFDTKKHGNKAYTFHEYCDNKGPTLVVVYLSNGNIIGGFTTQSWDGDGIWKEDKEAFLFSVELGRVFPIDKDFEEGIYCRGDIGPAFGSGHDLIIYGYCTSKKNSHVRKGNYGSADTSLWEFFLNGGEGNLDIISYEVYEIKK